MNVPLENASLGQEKGQAGVFWVSASQQLQQHTIHLRNSLSGSIYHISWSPGRRRSHILERSRIRLSYRPPDLGRRLHRVPSLNFVPLARMLSVLCRKGRFADVDAIARYSPPQNVAIGLRVWDISPKADPDHTLPWGPRTLCIARAVRVAW